jgi:hypothetical protein
MDGDRAIMTRHTADSFFDLGKDLPKIDAASLMRLLETEREVFERAFVPTSTLQSPDGEDTVQIKDKTFKRMRFYETRFMRIVFTRCRFDECLFLGAHFQDCEFHSCTFVRCNTHKFRLSRTYIDPRSFLADIFDKNRYANVGVDLFHTLLKNSADESQPEFRDVAEYHFRLWQRYNRTSRWKSSSRGARWLDFSFYGFWLWNVLFQKLFGYGVRVRNILFWTPLFFAAVWLYNHANWGRFGIDPQKLPDVPLHAKSAFFTVGNLSTFGTAELIPTTQFGLAATSCQIVLGITWIALSTAMIVKRFVR